MLQKLAYFLLARSIIFMSQPHIVHPAPGALPKQQTPAVPSYAWVVLGVVFLASTAAPLNQMKVPPIMPVLMEAFNLSIGSAGLLMSVFAITGFILALPAGIIVQRLGLKTTGLIAVGGLVVGSVLGALSSTAGLLLFSRVIEGVGMGLIAVVAPASIAMWFPPEKQGTPMGIWATWVPAGSLVMYLLAPTLAASFGWQSIWWFGAVIALLAFVLFWIFMRVPPSPAAQPGLKTGASPADEAPNMRKALANRSIWLLGLEFACFNLGLGAISTFYPTFLSAERGFSLAGAALTSSLMLIVVIFFAPLAGVLSDKIGSRKLVFTVPFLIVAVMMLFPFRITGWLIPAWMILLGVVVGAIPTATFSAAPEVMGKPQLAGFGMAVIMFGQNLGMFAGPVIVGPLIENAGWAAAGYAMIPVLLLGLVSGWLVKVR
jgi:predicted MFS family arabinose efflux permease